MSDSADVTFSIEDVTPALAQQWLKSNIGNRPCSPANVRALSAAMDRGEWMQNGETIKFDRDKILLDGQHRLQAVVSHGRPIEMAVIRGLDRSAFQTIDTGRNRTGGDVLSLRGIKNPTATAAAARMLFLYTTGDWGRAKSVRVTNVQLLKLMDKHDDFIDVSQEAMRAPVVTPLIPHSQCIFCYYMMQRTDKAVAKSFFSQFASGQYSNTPRANFISLLRDRLVSTSKEIIKPPPMVKLNWVISTWNAYYTNTPPGKLSRLVETVPYFRPDPFSAGNRAQTAQRSAGGRQRAG